MKYAWLLGFVAAAGTASAQTNLPDWNGIPFDRLNSFPTITGRSPAGAAMSPDGTKIVYAWNRTGARMRDLWMMDYPSGNQKMILEAAKIERPFNQDDRRTDEQKKEQQNYDGGFGGSAIWAPDSKSFLINHRGRTWEVSRDGKVLGPVFDGDFDASSYEFSEDGKTLFFISGGNVWRMDRATGKLKQLTFVTAGGTAVVAFDVSPDGKNIAIYWSNYSYQGDGHVMMDFTQERSVVRPIGRMWNGDVAAMNEKYGIVPAGGGKITYVSGIPKEHWGLGSRGAGWEWAPDSSGIVVGYKSEDHLSFTLNYVDAKTGKGFPIYTERAPSNYINNFRPFVWSRDSQNIFLGTDIWEKKFTTRYVLKLSKNGQSQTAYYKPNFDIANLQRPAKSDNLVVVVQNESPLRGNVAVVSPTGSVEIKGPIKDGWNAPVDFEQAGDVLVDDSGRHIASLCANLNINPEIYSLWPSEKRLTTSQTADYTKLTWPKTQEMTFKAADGRDVYVSLLLPKNYEKGKRYPLVVHNIYANSGKMDWDGFMGAYMAEVLGCVVARVDFRASWGQGGEFNSGYYQKMGLVDSEEAIALRKKLIDDGLVDPDRTAIWGWSYGGFLTCMTMTLQGGNFQTGVAVASVTEWKNYNHWYTRQRLGLVSEVPDVFAKTSPITYADKLQGNLLLIHGMLDDNVLFQDSVRFSMKMIDLGKQFDTFYYPRDDHSIGRDETRKHVQRKIVSYLAEKLGILQR